MNVELKKRLDAATGYLLQGLAGDAWSELDSLPRALRSGDAAIELRVETLLIGERWRFARVLAESQAKCFPENPAWWLQWAAALRQEKSIIEARGVLWVAVQRHPACALIHYNLACYSLILGEPEEVRNHTGHCARP